MVLLVKHGRIFILKFLNCATDFSFISTSFFGVTRTLMISKSRHTKANVRFSPMVFYKCTTCFLLLWPTLSLPCPILALAQNRIICRAHWLPPTYISTWLFDIMQKFCNSQQRQNDNIRSLVFLRDFCCQKW